MTRDNAFCFIRTTQARLQGVLHPSESTQRQLPTNEADSLQHIATLVDVVGVIGNLFADESPHELSNA